ncbi:BAR_ACAPs and ArfGap_ACAP domain-containing protein [Antennarius striatus]|uniref:BAR_ACAPs and ArfGap_ACAP domain-containing protein n=1 Tax=Antennarius striatus TaxID=241820 RepID=UPI0035AF8CB9
MEPLLDFEECLEDSPHFRLKLERFEDDVTELETHLDKVMRLCGNMVEAGQAYSAANQELLNGLAEISTRHEKDDVIRNCWNQLNQGLQELVGFHTMLLDQTQRSLLQQLNALSVQFRPPLLETRRAFLRIGGDVEAAALRNAQAPRHKVADAERASHVLLATRKCFQHFALDYCLQLNAFRTQQRVDVLNAVLSFVHAHFTFFHQGFDLLRDLEPTLRIMGTQVTRAAADVVAKRKDLESRHQLVQQRATGEPPLGRCPGDDDIIHGFLFKRSRRKSSTWRRGWFSVRHNQLLYRKSHKEEDLVLFDDLRLCAVKPLEGAERRFCWELLSVHKRCLLQADSEQLRGAWLAALRGSIDLAYRQKGDAHNPTQTTELLPPLEGGPSSPAPPTQKAPALGVALRGPGNRLCCDCGEAEPRWASVNLGVTVCIECSGIHRSLGVHLSKVRSLTLDSWEAEQLKLLCILGNDVMNRIYEARCSEEGRVKPRPHSPRADKEAWIRDKYVDRRFVVVGGGAIAGGDAVGLRLYRASLAGDLPAMAVALAEGAELNRSVAEEEGRTALIGAAVGGSLSACEFLLLNGANVNHRDRTGRGALHAAAAAGHTGQVCLLLRRGANQYAADERGQDPLAIAVETANADIVTLLRMARMNEEMRDAEGGFGAAGDDETFQEIFRDFSDMASHDPERLSRRQFSRGGEEEEEEEGGGASANANERF